MKDIVVIGAGIVGASIAHALSKYNLNVLVLEKELDVATGTTKANSALIHAGYDCLPNTLKAKLNVRGNTLYYQYAEELNFPLRKIGSLVLSFSEENDAVIETLYQQGLENKVPDLQILSQAEVLALEPHVNSSVSSALFAPTAAIICPFEATLAFAENAILNGVEFKFDYPVTSIQKKNDYYLINNEIETKYIINSAGLYADEIAALIGDTQYKIIPRKGEYYLLDKQGSLVNHILFPTPSKMGKGVLITPTVHGNILVGPTAMNLLESEKENTTVTGEGLSEILDSARITLPSLSVDTSITNFAGVRSLAGPDFVIESTENNPNCIHLIGISSPGLASAPAIAEYVCQLLQKSNLSLTKKENYLKERKKPIHILEMKKMDLDALIQKNSLYGRIVCRCEMVSEQEIIDCFNSPLPPNTIDGIKRRIRPGMGRCQGSFCGSRVMELLHEHMHIEMTKLLKSTRNSFLLDRQLKEEHHE